MKIYAFAAVLVLDCALVAGGYQPWWWWIVSLVGLAVLLAGLHLVVPLTDDRGNLKRELSSDVEASRRLVKVLALSTLGLGLSAPGFISDALALVACVVTLTQIDRLASRERARK